MGNLNRARYGSLTFFGRSLFERKVLRIQTKIQERKGVYLLLTTMLAPQDLRTHQCQPFKQTATRSAVRPPPLCGSESEVPYFKRQESRQGNHHSCKRFSPISKSAGRKVRRQLQIASLRGIPTQRISGIGTLVPNITSEQVLSTSCSPSTDFGPWVVCTGCFRNWVREGFYCWDCGYDC